MTIETLVDELLKASKVWDADASAGQADLHGLPKMRELAERILDHLVWNPGVLIHFSDSQKMRDAQQAVDHLWREEVETDEDLYHKILYGIPQGNLGIGAELTFTYAERLKRLKPTFIAVKPPPEVASYFEEAMAAWLRGLDRAALILCWSVLDNILKEKLPAVKTCKIEAASEAGILDETNAKRADEIRKLRNDAVHNGKHIAGEVSRRSILITKQIIEKLLSSE